MPKYQITIELKIQSPFYGTVESFVQVIQEALQKPEQNITVISSEVIDAGEGQ